MALLIENNEEKWFVLKKDLKNFQNNEDCKYFIKQFLSKF